MQNIFYFSIFILEYSAYLHYTFINLSADTSISKVLNISESTPRNCKVSKRCGSNQ
jgi:hypothetical protein